jgi:predicted double-glycine peptidase
MHMRVTERIRLVTDEIMQNQVTVEDPEYLTGPWTWTWMYKRWPGYKLQEYVCEDNRYFEDPSLRYQRLRID